MSNKNLLSMDYLKQEAEETHRTEEYELDNGIKVKFYPVFPGSMIQDVVAEAQDIAKQTQDVGIDFDDNQFNHHILFLCIKHFTHLKDEIANDLETQLQQFQYLVDTGMYETIINNIFHQDEIAKVFEKIADLRAQYETLVNLEDMTADKIRGLDFVQQNLLANMEKSQKALDKKLEKNEK